MPKGNTDVREFARLGCKSKLKVKARFSNHTRRRHKKSQGYLDSGLNVEEDLFLFESGLEDEDPCDPTYDGSSEENDNEDDGGMQHSSSAPFTMNIDFPELNATHSLSQSQSQSHSQSPLQPSSSKPDLGRIVRSRLKEYFCSEDPSDIIELCNGTSNTVNILMEIINISYDCNNSKRELVSRLISHLSLAHAATVKDLEKCFDSLLASLEESIVDVPKAPAMLARFIVRVVCDECIPPCYLSRSKDSTSISGNKVIEECIKEATSLYSIHHNSTRIEHIWGHGAEIENVEEMRNDITQIIEEVLQSGDLPDACSCFTDLGAPHFHHEIVYQIVVRILRDGHMERVSNVLCRLLCCLDSRGCISSNQFESGFSRVYKGFSDLLVDMPRARVYLEDVVVNCVEHGVIPQKFIRELPSRPSRKRFISRGDGGKIKE